MAATSQGNKPYIKDFDPREVLDSNSTAGANIRTSIGELEELAASIGESETGMVQFPILVPREDGTMRLVAGFRRVTAAIEAELESLHFTVRADWAHLPLTDIRAAMIVENTHRKDLTVKEEADAYAQLALDGMPVAQIAKATGRKRDFVEGKLALSKLTDDKAIQLANENRLNPEIAAALQEFEGQPKIQERIIRKVGEYTNLGRWGGEHIANAERAKQQARISTAERMQELRQGGAVILKKKPENFGHSSREADVTTLRDADGNSLDGDKLVFKPGFAAMRDSNQGYPRVVIVCLDPEKHGYTRRSYDRFVTDEARAEEERAEAARTARAEALAAAAQVRHRFYAETYGNARSKLAKAILAQAQRLAAMAPGSLSFYGDGNRLVTSISGTDPDTVTEATSTDRIHRILIARYVVYRERKLTAAIAYDRPDHEAAAWLDQLVAAGYELSETETTARATLRGEHLDTADPRTSTDDHTRPCPQCGADIDEWCDDECALYDTSDEYEAAPVPDETVDDPGDTRPPLAVIDGAPDTDQDGETADPAAQPDHLPADDQLAHAA